MKLNEIYQLKHELWLKILFISFAITNEKIKNELYEMSQIEFRHLKWLGNKLKEEKIEYDYDRFAIDFAKNTTHESFSYLLNELQLVMKNYNPDDVLFARMLSDEYFLIVKLNYYLQNSENKSITAFNKERIYQQKTLSKESVDALTIFLFEETYKEYELIMIYSYMQNYTNDITLYNVYQDLIDESHYHLKCFGNMLSIMGILAIPRMLLKEIYKRDDIKKFLLDGVEEEKMAKEECQKLALAVKDDELSKFFEFINYQENYHIELMKKAIKMLAE
ncbi:MAG: iron-binding protein [Epsilonproteobacteria bacterium]|nr:iron-binding protein [Campylobacterota bacterium]